MVYSLEKSVVLRASHFRTTNDIRTPASGCSVLMSVSPSNVNANAPVNVLLHCRCPGLLLHACISAVYRKDDAVDITAAW